MRINEVQLPSTRAIQESVNQGKITESVGLILTEHVANQWSGPMTAEECDAEDARILAEARLK
jgi:hypothetical protein